MADKKISALPAATTPLAGTEVLTIAYLSPLLTLLIKG
jgi:hypothetical protein